MFSKQHIHVILKLGEDRRTEGNAGKGRKRKDKRKMMSTHTGKHGKKNGKTREAWKEDEGR